MKGAGEIMEMGDDSEHTYVPKDRERRCLCTRLLVIVVGLFLLAALLVMFSLYVLKLQNKQDAGNTANVCLSPDCVTMAANIITSLDPKVDPCEDFYGFACGGWLREKVIPEDAGDLSPFEILHEQVSVKVKRLLEKRRNAKDPDYVNKAKDLYASCMDTYAIDKKGGKPIKDLLKSLGLGDWPTWKDDEFDLTDVASKILLETSTEVLFSVCVDRDDKNSSRHVIMMDQVTFRFPKESIRVGRRDKRVMAYQMFIQSTAFLTMDPKDEKQALEVAQGIVDFEIQLTKEIDWGKYMNNVFGEEGVNVADVKNAEIIINRSPSFFAGLVKLLKDTDKKILAGYMGWKVVQKCMELLSEPYRQLWLEFNKVLIGRSQAPPRYQTCYEKAALYLPMAVGQMYVKDNFNCKTKAAATEMIANIQEAFNELVDEQDWMDDQTRKSAKEKNAYIDVRIGYPKEMTDDDYNRKLYEKLTISANDYFGNVLKAKSMHLRSTLSKLTKPSDKIWKDGPTTVNAMYSYSHNRLMIPAGILHPPFFSVTNPKSLNYGAMGVIMGHEITHAFDDAGRQYDKNGNAIQWWSDSAIQKFKDKVQCLVDQYSGYVARDVNKSTNAIHTQGENIADNGGLRESFTAYRNWVKAQGKEEPLLPGLNFTHDQLFFIGYANMLCGKSRRETLDLHLEFDPHSPYRFRVVGALQNSKDFNRAFTCKPGSYMNPTKKCTVW